MTIMILLQLFIYIIYYQNICIAYSYIVVCLIISYYNTQSCRAPKIASHEKLLAQTPMIPLHTKNKLPKALYLWATVTTPTLLPWYQFVWPFTQVELPTWIYDFVSLQFMKPWPSRIYKSAKLFPITNVHK